MMPAECILLQLSHLFNHDLLGQTWLATQGGKVGTVNLSGLIVISIKNKPVTY